MDNVSNCRFATWSCIKLFDLSPFSLSSIDVLKISIKLFVQEVTTTKDYWHPIRFFKNIIKILWPIWQIVRKGLWGIRDIVRNNFVSVHVSVKLFLQKLSFSYILKEHLFGFGVWDLATKNLGFRHHAFVVRDNNHVQHYFSNSYFLIYRNNIRLNHATF